MSYVLLPKVKELGLCRLIKDFTPLTHKQKLKTEVIKYHDKVLNNFNELKKINIISFDTDDENIVRFKFKIEDVEYKLNFNCLVFYSLFKITRITIKSNRFGGEHSDYNLYLFLKNIDIIIW